MANYRNVYMQFWTDRKVIDNFTANDRYLYLYFLTNPHTSLCGCYEVSMNMAIVETGLTIVEIEESLERLENNLNVIRYSHETGEVLILNWPKYNWTKSGNTGVGVRNGIEAVKNIDFKGFLEECYEQYYLA